MSRFTTVSTLVASQNRDIKDNIVLFIVFLGYCTYLFFYCSRTIPSPRGPDRVFSPDQVPPIFFYSWNPKCGKKIGGPFQNGSFNATGTIRGGILNSYDLNKIVGHI